MAYVITATLSNGKHPENGSTQILFPLSRQEYSDAIGHLEELEVGDAVARDCVVEEIDSSYEVLGCLEGKAVNVDELDFLAKRLDSFDEYEAQQFQAACHAFGCRDIQSLINMTFCCQETTVIGDFSKLEEAGKHHYLTTHGGAAPAEEMERVDGKAVAEELFQSKKGVLTPYGLFFCNKWGGTGWKRPTAGWASRSICGNGLWPRWSLRTRAAPPRSHSCPPASWPLPAFARGMTYICRKRRPPS